MSTPACQKSNCLAAAFTMQVTRLSCQGSAHVVVLAVDGDITASPDSASKGLLINLQEPAVRINRLWNRRQAWERRAGHPRRLVATRACLVGSLLVVMSQKSLGDLLYLLKSARSMHLQALLAQGAMKALDMGGRNRDDAGG